MICEHCKEEMKDGATVCPHCRKTTGAAKGKRTKTVLAWLGGAVVLFVAFVVVVNIISPAPANPADRIKASCDREFGAETPESTACSIRLMVEYMDKQQQDRISRARSGA